MSEATLQFHRLTFVPEPDGILVGRPDIESYAVLPADGAELLRRMADGMPAEQAATWYQDTFGERLDIDDFIESLHDLGFVRAAGEERAAPLSVRYQALGKAVFSPLAWICYTGLIIGCAVAMAYDPQLRPAPHNVFFSSSLIAIQVLLTLAQLPALLWHEGFHVLAGQRLGLPSRLRLSRRMYFPVIETELNGLLSVRRNKRYLPFLAGMLSDVLLFSGLTLAAAFDARDGLSWVGGLALAVAYATVLRLAWQFFVFLRTDLYYVFTTALGCTDLHAATSAYLRERFSRLPGVRPSTADETEWSPRDRAMAPWFGLVTVLGVAFLLAWAVFAIVPVMVGFFTRLVEGLASGDVAATGFWDSAVTLAILVTEFFVLPILAGRSERRTQPDKKGMRV